MRSQGTKPEGQKNSTKPLEIAASNPFNQLSFWEFTLLSTLTVAFFPWSLLATFLLFGSETTKNLVAALVQDFLKTIGAVLLGLGIIIAILFWAFW